jgi:hypothetical protein
MNVAEKWTKKMQTKLRRRDSFVWQILGNKNLTEGHGVFIIFSRERTNFIKRNFLYLYKDKSFF